MLQTILSISGKPGLYKLVSRGNNNLIVEVLDETKKNDSLYLPRIVLPALLI